MKKIIIIVLALLLTQSCKLLAPQDYVSLSGKITHKKSDFITISKQNKVIKKIALARDGSFTDTLHVAKGNYTFSDGGEYAGLFLYPNSKLTITLDTEQFDETLKFSGRGSEENNYTVKRLLEQEELFEHSDALYKLSKEDFVTFIDSVKTTVIAELKAQKDFDGGFVEENLKNTEMNFAYIVRQYDMKVRMNKLIGKPTPKFVDYENHDGTTTSMTELQGKYIYIDVWATWCRPCLGEIPALKELEKELGNKMHFLSISVDQEKQHDAWKKMVSKKNLKGIQLYANKNWASTFIQDFGINSIPRFILIDPKGNVVNPNMSRPSEAKTGELLRSLVN